LRALGTSEQKRVALLPDVPTMTEQGLKGYEVLTWYGVWAPAGTPENIVQKIHADLKAALANEAVKKRFAASGLDPQRLATKEFSDFIDNEGERYEKILDAAGLPKN